MINEPIRAAVISDTHGLLRPEVERILQSCDVVIHAGDFDNQMVFHKLKIKQPTPSGEIMIMTGQSSFR